MKKNRRRYLRIKLLLACYASGIIGIMGVIGFLLSTSTLTIAHIKDMFWPGMVLVVIDAIAQYMANEWLLKRFFQWVGEEKHNNDIEFTRAAQIEILDYPPRGSGVSLLSWIFSGVTISLFLYAWGNEWSPRLLINLTVLICSGGFVSALFQYYFHKRFFRRNCHDLLNADTGLYREQTVTKLDMRTEWLIGILILLTVGMTYAALMGKRRAEVALMKQTAQLIIPVGYETQQKASEGVSRSIIDEYLDETSNVLDQNIFLFDGKGEIIYGKIPVELTSENVRKYIKEQDDILVKIFHTQKYYSRNIGSLNDEFLWIPLDQGRYIGTVFYHEKAAEALHGFKLTIFILIVFFVIIAIFVAYFVATDIREQQEKLRQSRNELEASYSKLKELDELKTAFFANISHELRTPLTMSIAPLETLLSGNRDKLDDYLSTMHRNMLRLLNLINNLLDFSKLEAGRMKLKVQEDDIGNLTKYMVGSVESWADRSGIDISYALDKKLPPVYLDREKMEKVFLNLLSNSIKFTDKGGRIKVRVDKHEDRIAVSIQDNGVGIPEDAMDKIFDRFSQADGSTNREYEGTGIGLAIVKEFVELHGGKVEVESTIGEGSTFTFELPLGKDHFDPAKVEFLEGEYKPEDISTMKAVRAISGMEVVPEQEEVEVSQSDERPTVLVVEDNPDMRGFIRDVISARFAVQTAKDGEEGVAKAMELMPALVLSDVMMPKKDGNQLCRELKSDQRTRHIPVILLTARAEISMKIEGLEKGADDYLIKPFNSQELLTRVSNLIQFRAAEREMMEAKLGRFLPPKLARDMLHGSEDLLATTKRKKLTIFFSDIRGFTKLSDGMEPEESVELLNHYLREMTNIIYEYEGTLDKFIGDGIMVFFGDPIEQEDHAKRAVKMSVAMQKRMDELQKEWFEAGSKPLSIGIGINTGYCTVGGIGSERHMDYTVIGNQVNLAARLQGLAAGGEIIISHATYGEVKDIVDTDDRGEVEIKGIQQPVRIYHIKGLKEGSS